MAALFNGIEKRNKSREDYLETIFLLSKQLENVHQIEVARKLGVTQPAVLKMLRFLKDDDYIITDGLHIHLTEKGEKYASEVYRVHCTVRSFLIKIGVGEADAEVDACEIEHCISEATFTAMEKFLNS